MTAWNNYYLAALETIMYEGVKQHNARTDQEVLAYPGLHIRYDLNEFGFPLLTARKIPIKLFVSEMVWFLSGAHDIKWLQAYTNVWDNFIESNGQLAAAYGKRWRATFGRDQIRNLKRMIEVDPSSRQLVVMCWHPGRDGLTNQGVIKNVPCLPSFTINIIGDKLNISVEARSNDMMLGCPHDFAGYALLAHILAGGTGYKPGIMSYHVAHAHIYADHLDKAKKLIKRDAYSHKAIELDVKPNWLGDSMCADGKLMDGVVSEIVGALAAQYDPLPSIGKLKLFE